MKSKKGSKFERELCRQLSVWWSPDGRDDLFWRTAGSGGRATVRSSKGKTTRGHYGDIQATDPSAAPLLQVVTIEAKRGYSKHSFADLVDRPDKAAAQQWEEFLQQAIDQAKAAGTPYWLLISQRDKRKRMVFMPLRFYNTCRLTCADKWAHRPKPSVMFSVSSRSFGDVDFVGMELEEFLFRVTRKDILFIRENHREGRPNKKA